MKRCPFCGNEPLKHLETAICSTCKISLPIDVWEGRLDTEHVIDGIRWMNSGTVIKSSRFFTERVPVAMRNDLVKMMGGDWHEATAAGYCKVGHRDCHRYSIMAGAQTFLIQCQLEQDAVDIGCKFHAQAVGTGGFIARYSTAEGVPVMYVASMRSSTKETL